MTALIYEAPFPHLADFIDAVGKEELRFLAILRDKLGRDKLVTAALERGAIARHQEA